MIIENLQKQSQIKLYATIKYENNDKLQAGINRVFDVLIEKILRTLESGGIDFKVLDKKFYYIAESLLNANARDPTLIPMKRAMPISYKFISGIGLNVPQQEGYCVVEYLINFYTKIKLSVERIEAIIRKGLGQQYNNIFCLKP